MTHPGDRLRAFYVQATLSWGFVVRHSGVSAAQPAYLLPPPTTIVGAFAQPIARAAGLNPYQYGRLGPSLEWGEGRLISPLMRPFLESTVVAAAGFIASDGEPGVGLAIHQEVSRIAASMYRGGEDIRRMRRAKLKSTEFFEEAVTRAIPVQAVGAAYAPGVRVELLWIFDVVKLSEGLGIGVDELEGVVEKAAYGLSRLGSKEGLVAVEPETVVYDRSPKILPAGSRVRTRLYVDASCVEPLDPESSFRALIPGLDYKSRLHYVGAHFASSLMLVPLREKDPPPTYRVLEPCKAISASAPHAVGVSL